MGLSLVSGPFAINFWAMVIKALFIVVVAVQIPPVMVWLERRAPALMQRRRGPNRVGLFGFRLLGLLQSAADAIKLIFKEESVAKSAYPIIYHLAPVLNLFPALLVFGSVPFGLPIEIGGVSIPLRVVELNVGFLFILAMSGIAVYGTTLAGWAAGSKFSMLGSLRASAQMISYEIPMGLSLVPIALVYESLDLQAIIMGQEHVWNWGIFLCPISFFIFVITMFAETNRAPFDLAEGESELVAGFHVEYGSAKFALFFLSEYVAMFALGLVASALFLGGWQIPFVSHVTLVNHCGTIGAAIAGGLTLFLKGGLFMWLFVWVRWTLPRFRYDQLMSLGWKYLLPLALANILVTAVILSIRFIQ